MSLRHRRRSRPRVAFTLIEVLAVVAIAALVVTFAAANLHGVAASTEMMRTRASLSQMDARGRMHARASGEAVTLALSVEDRIVRLFGTRSGTWLGELHVPSAVAITVELPRNASNVVFDRRGASDDYSLVLRDETHAVRLSVAGLTGDIIESEVEP